MLGLLDPHELFFSREGLVSVLMFSLGVIGVRMRWLPVTYTVDYQVHVLEPESSNRGCKDPSGFHDSLEAVLLGPWAGTRGADQCCRNVGMLLKGG